MRLRRLVVSSLVVLGFGSSLGCSDDTYPFDPADPGRGPADLIAVRQPLNESFSGGESSAVAANAAAPEVQDDALPPCDATCRDYCAGQNLENPVDAAACRGLWGVGLSTQPINDNEACRRLHADMLGILPTHKEARARCGDRTYSEIVQDMLQDPAFVQTQQRLWADLLRYNNEAMSVERIYDADKLVGMLYEGRLAFDEFAAVLSAHPVLTRRYDNAGDRAAALFELLLGRPPYDHERSDMARLYSLWSNGYYDHPTLGMRLPDAVIEFRCLNDNGQIDEATKGACTSVLWGYKELILTPDYRAVDGELWSGLLTAEEWAVLQEPGRILARQPAFWEYAADRVLQQYLGYDVATTLPEVREALVDYVLQHQGDVRALHYAVATSQLYLQSNGGATATTHRHTYGPLKQIQVEPWLDTIKARTGFDLGQCDHRIPDPGNMMRADSVAALQLLEDSAWEVTEDGVRRDYLNLARTLGGCPDNSVGGRFTTVSILTTATQEGFVARVCNPSLDKRKGASLDKLIPSDLRADTALTADVAEEVLNFQVQQFYGRGAGTSERDAAREAADMCAPRPCSVESFARPLCYALLSSSEMLFY